MSGDRTPPVDRDLVVGRLAAIRERIASAAADPAAVTLVAVTKGFGPDAVAAALSLGLVDVGENYADELVAKAAAVAGTGADPAGVARATGMASPARLASPADAAGVAGVGEAVRWHFLGAIQRNKVPRLAPLVACWQGLSRLAEGRAIATRAPGARVLVQVDAAGLPGRNGCRPSEVPDLVAALRDEDLDVAGLMAVGPPGTAEAARPGFRLVSTLADRLDLPVRSMGMTDDLEVAVSEGSTMVRLGRALFGDRPPRAPAR